MVDRRFLTDAYVWALPSGSEFVRYGTPEGDALVKREIKRMRKWLKRHDPDMREGAYVPENTGLDP